MTNGEYTPRFIEDYAIRALKENPDMTDEEVVQVAQKFIREHGEKYDAYLRSLGAFVASTFKDEINILEGMKDKLKEDFITALQKRGILPEDESDGKLRILRDYIKNVKLTFTSIGGGYGGTETENYVNVDWIQTYKFITDFPAQDFSFYNMAIVAVFHELAHRLSFFLGNPTKFIDGYGKYRDEEEKFGEGVAHIIANCLGIRDDFTSYYKIKEKEIKTLDRNRMVRIIMEIHNISYKLKISVLNQRCYNLVGIFGFDERNPRRIELYANPYGEVEIKVLVKTALEKFQPA